MATRNSAATDRSVLERSQRRRAEGPDLRDEPAAGLRSVRREAQVAEDERLLPEPPSDEPLSLAVPKSCAHSVIPPLATAAPDPVTVYDGFSMFALCPGEPSHPATTLDAVEYPSAMFSPQPAP